MTVPEIRAATPDDLETLVTLTLELRRVMAALNPAALEPSPDEVRNIARGYLEGPTNLVLLARDGDRPAGFIRVNVRHGDELAPLPGRRLSRRETLKRKLRAWRGLRRPAPAALYIADLYVRPDCRRRGVGAALVAAAQAGTAALDPAYSYIMVLAENPEGRAFWEKVGFRSESLVMVRR